jgi:hypothetical protein
MEDGAAYRDCLIIDTESVPLSVCRGKQNSSLWILCWQIGAYQGKRRGELEGPGLLKAPHLPPGGKRNQFSLEKRHIKRVAGTYHVRWGKAQLLNLSEIVLAAVVN